MKQLLLTAIIFLSITTNAASTGTLLLSGVVEPVNDISIAPTASATTLNITNGEITKLVATATETSNNLTGYKITMRSTNSSKLVHTIDNSKFTTYTISYNGGPYISLTTTDQEVKNVTSLNGLTTQSSDIKVNVVAYPTAPTGTYNDLVTISIAAN